MLAFLLLGNMLKPENVRKSRRIGRPEYRVSHDRSVQRQPLWKFGCVFPMRSLSTALRWPLWCGCDVIGPASLLSRVSGKQQNAQLCVSEGTLCGWVGPLSLNN